MGGGGGVKDQFIPEKFLFSIRMLTSFSTIIQTVRYFFFPKTKRGPPGDS